MPDPAKEVTKPKRKLSKRRLALISVIAAALLICGTVAGVVIAAIAKTPPFDPGKLTNTQQTSIIYDKDGNQIGVLHAKENRQVADSKEIPLLVKQAFVTVEDIRFYQHHGVDPVGIARALVSDLTGKKLQGGSTITIQLARGAFLTPEQTITRKIQEAVLALKIERLYTKDEILTFYLNRIYFGESAYGIKAAAKTYFGKDLKDLDVAEIAMLAGLPQAPTGYDPYTNPEQAKRRRSIVLGVLRDNGVISQEQYEKAINEPFSYVDEMKKENKNPKTENQSSVQLSYQYPYFVDYVIHELEDKYGISEDAIYAGGLKIYTTVDPKIQTAMENAFADPNNFPKNIDGQPVEGAMVIEDPKDGSIRAMVGGRNYQTARDFNRAWQAQRQPGSSIKPLAVYAPALAKGGYFPGTVLDDEPVSYQAGDGKRWTPTDDDGAWRGLITMRYALQNSINVYAVKLLDQIGVDYGWQFAKDKFGLPLTNKDKVLSLALGTPQVSVLDMVSAFSAFPTGGVKADSHSVLKVEDNKGTLIVDNSNVAKKRIISEQVAYLMEDMLRGVVTGGTGTAAQFGNWFVAGKTGTSSMSDYKRSSGTRDIWFVGFTPDYVGGVWMGFDNSTDRRNMRGYYGGGPPAQLWRKVMMVAHEGLPVISSIPKPDGLSYITYDSKAGLPPSSLTPSQFIKQDYAISGALPQGISKVWFTEDVDADTGLLPGPYTRATVTKVFLNVKRTGPWPPDEAPYRPPTEISNTPPAVPSAAPAPDSGSTNPSDNSGNTGTNSGSGTDSSSTSNSGTNGSNTPGTTPGTNPGTPSTNSNQDSGNKNQQKGLPKPPKLP